MTGLTVSRLRGQKSDSSGAAEMLLVARETGTGQGGPLVEGTLGKLHLCFQNGEKHRVSSPALPPGTPLHPTSGGREDKVKDQSLGRMRQDVGWLSQRKILTFCLHERN